ncbi:MAG TPA: response regulator [Aggregatilinea sp.]|jgi:CheY-like chemotaxis protein|uniref:response regulator transcription factor n=1 Tax=Aggregatilinea sp. TaxID=2806333 RepID=UPI002BD34E73|nr:response regulator [Aggregatilinea sp.]HML21447.1 response regulator [Aggregatilinea sp.]
MARIIVIEDEEPLRESILTLLSFEGYEASGAADGYSGLAQIRQQIPDAIICDLMLPGIDGFEIVKTIHSEPATASVRVIFLSALSDQTVIAQAKDLGVTSYLIKPVTFDLLLGALQRVLGADAP